jgi:hypothetical protein
MTTVERLHDIAEALERHAAASLVLLPADALAIACALHGEADAITIKHRQRSVRAWQTRKAA